MLKLFRNPQRAAQKPPARLQTWLAGWFNHRKNRRSAPRSCLPGLCAYYWEGGIPAPQEVLNISQCGACLAATARWKYPGTIVELTLQRAPGSPSEAANPPETLRVVSKVVRSGPGGIGIRFIFTHPRERRHVREFLAAMRSEEGGL